MQQCFSVYKLLVMIDSFWAPAEIGDLKKGVMGIGKI